MLPFFCRAPVRIFDRRPVRKEAVTPSRDEAAQARLLDVQRILHFWERQQRSCLKSYRQGFACFGRDADE
jgi:hypothetical protein